MTNENVRLEAESIPEPKVDGDADLGHSQNVDLFGMEGMAETININFETIKGLLKILDERTQEHHSKLEILRKNTLETINALNVKVDSDIEMLEARIEVRLDEKLRKLNKSKN